VPCRKRIALVYGGLKGKEFNTASPNLYIYKIINLELKYIAVVYGPLSIMVLIHPVFYRGKIE
jgi:hypothetical protein